MPALHLKHGERGSFPASRRARRNCLKVAGPAGKKLRVKKNCFVWQVACAQRLWQIYLAIWQIAFHETDDGEVMKMQAHYTDPLKPARPPLSTTPYRRFRCSLYRLLLRLLCLLLGRLRRGLSSHLLSRRLSLDSVVEKSGRDSVSAQLVASLNLAVLYAGRTRVYTKEMGRQRKNDITNCRG